MEVSQTPRYCMCIYTLSSCEWFTVRGWDGKIRCLFLEITMNLHLVLLSCRWLSSVHSHRLLSEGVDSLLASVWNDRVVYTSSANNDKVPLDREIEKISLIYIKGEQ